MMSTVGEALAEFHANTTDAHESTDLSRGAQLRGMTQWLKTSVLSVVDITVPISTTYSRLVEAANLYSSTTQTDAATRRMRFRAFEGALHAFGTILDTADPSEEAITLRTVDPTPVPNPVADILKTHRSA